MKVAAGDVIPVVGQRVNGGSLDLSALLTQAGELVER
jgi:hypothetical protein